MPNRFIYLLCSILFVACNNSELPKALENKKSIIEIASKRGEEDMIESLYRELAANDTTLEKLELELKQLNAAHEDSIAAFQLYEGKSSTYYHSAAKHLVSITDSSFREKIAGLIQQHQHLYDSITLPNRRLNDSIRYSAAKINDLYEALKLVRTMAVMQDYQQNKLPDTKALHKLIIMQKEVLIYADSILHQK